MTAILRANPDSGANEIEPLCNGDAEGHKQMPNFGAVDHMQMPDSDGEIYERISDGDSAGYYRLR